MEDINDINKKLDGTRDIKSTYLTNLYKLERKINSLEREKNNNDRNIKELNKTYNELCNASKTIAKKRRENTILAFVSMVILMLISTFVPSLNLDIITIAVCAPLEYLAIQYLETKDLKKLIKSVNKEELMSEIERYKEQGISLDVEIIKKNKNLCDLRNYILRNNSLMRELKSIAKNNTVEITDVVSENKVLKRTIY